MKTYLLNSRASICQSLLVDTLPVSMPLLMVGLCFFIISKQDSEHYSWI